MYTTLEKFEQGRLALALEGLLITLRGIKSFYKSYMKARQEKADRDVMNYVKNHADFERLQRNLTRLKTNALYYSA